MKKDKACTPNVLKEVRPVFGNTDLGNQKGFAVGTRGAVGKKADCQWVGQCANERISPRISVRRHGNFFLSQADPYFACLLLDHDRVGL